MSYIVAAALEVIAPQNVDKKKIIELLALPDYIKKHANSSINNPEYIKKYPNSSIKGYLEAIQLGGIDPITKRKLIILGNKGNFLR